MFFCLQKFIPDNQKIIVDKSLLSAKIVLNQILSLSREVEGTGPAKPGNLANVKVPNPADYPKDEVLMPLFWSGIIF